jgi:hypothetical protein
MVSCPGPHHRRGDRHPSLQVKEDLDGTVWLKCFSGGCSADEIVRAVGLELSDLFPEKLTHRRSPTPLKVLKTDVFDLVMHEIGIVWVIGCDMSKGETITEGDHKRLCQAVATLERIAGTAYEH